MDGMLGIANAFAQHQDGGQARKARGDVHDGAAGEIERATMSVPRIDKLAESPKSQRG